MVGALLALAFLPVLFLVYYAVPAALLAITVVGVLLLPFVQFYGQVAVFRMFGSAFATVNDRIESGPAGSGTREV